MKERTFRLATVAAAVAAALLVWDLSTWLFPYHSLNHDEAVYLQQAASLLEGQLHLDPPVEGAFRPWFFFESGGRLYPKYAPVPAAIFAVGRLLGGYRLALVGVAAANVGLVSLVAREVLDRRSGLLAGALVLFSPLFLLDSAVFLPYAPTTLLNLVFAYAYLRADRSGDRRWAAAAGAAIGLAFFARPFTAVLFAAPFVTHALWTLRGDFDHAIPWPVATVATGMVGVGVALAYNAATTGSPFLFPYEAFAPLDGLGFGRREILGHDVRYDPELAIRANSRVVELFLTEWFVGGLLGSGLAAVGVLLVARRGFSAREAALAGLFASIVVGNVYFWGNLNVLGAIERPGDGLISILGPYYHFDLLLPTAAFAARGALGIADGLRRVADEHLQPRPALASVLAVLLVLAGGMAGVTAQDLDRRLEANAATTETYETVYGPFEGGEPADSVVLLPTPYGPWLNHPFQALRNDPGYDGETVYAVDERPFAVADAFPDRRLFRYTYRGTWAPFAGSPRAARLQRVQDVAGGAVHLDANLGVPEEPIGVTARLATDGGSAYFVGSNVSGRLDLRLTVDGERAALAGNLSPAGDDSVPVDGPETVVLTVFVDYGAGGSFTYRLDLPVDAADGRVRALSPRVEYCRSSQACGGSAAYVPETAPEGVFVGTRLEASNTTDKFRSA